MNPKEKLSRMKKKEEINSKFLNQSPNQIWSQRRENELTVPLPSSSNSSSFAPIRILPPPSGNGGSIFESAIGSRGNNGSFENRRVSSRLVWTREWTWETGEHGRKRNTKTIQVLAVVERFAWRSRIARARARSRSHECWWRAGMTSLGWVGASEPADNDEEVTTTRCKELPRSTNQKRFSLARRSLARFIKESMHGHARSSIFIKVITLPKFDRIESSPSN